MIFSCYVKFDIIRRILENHFQIPVFQVMNITDVDDKIISKAQTLNKDPIQLARFASYIINIIKIVFLLLV